MLSSSPSGSSVLDAGVSGMTAGMSASPSGLLGGGTVGSGGIGVEREMIRSAARVLVREVVHRRSSVGAVTTATTSTTGRETSSTSSSHATGVPGLSKDAWDAIESRMRGLVRLEKIWRNGGGGGASSFAGGAGAGGAATASAGSSAGGIAEERERRVFGEALKDGYVLCQ